MRSVFQFALGVALLCPAVATAQTIGPEQAQALQRQLKDWAAGLLGPSLKLPELPLAVTAEQDHYRLALHIAGFDGPDGDVAMTARVHPLDGDRWSIDSLRAPPTGNFSVTLPQNNDPALSGPMKLSFTIARQDTHGLLDPSFATDSTLHTEVAGFVMSSDNAKQRQEERIDSYITDTDLKPARDGQLDLTSTGTLEGWKSATEVNGQTPMAFGARTIRAEGRIDGINRDHVGRLLVAAGGVAGAMPNKSDTGKNDLPEPAKAQLRLVIASLQDMASSIRMQETMDDVQVELAGMGGVTIKHFKLGFGGEAPDGKLHAWLDIGLDGLNSPTIPPNVAAYLPAHFEIKPSFSGVQTADVEKMAMDATQDDSKDAFGADLAALFSHGGANVNLETLSFDLGPAKVDGTGTFTALSPSQWHGEAHLTATGLDELIKRAHDDPDLQQALPALVMLRGLAKPDGDRLVWNIVSDGPKLTVNGLDMSALTGGKAKPDQATKP